LSEKKKVMKKFGIITIAIIGSFFFQITESFASHTAGMDIFYRWKPLTTSDSTYEFTLIFYRNCQGFTATAPGSVQITARSASVNITNYINAPGLPTSGTNVPPLEPPDMYNCTKSFNSLCYEEYVYRGDWKSPKRAFDWKFSYELCCRPVTNAPTNITNGTQHIECGLNNLDFPDYKAKNWSPLWHNRRPNHPGHLTDTIINFLFRTLCSYNFYTLDMAVREYQGDSMSYSFYWPQDNGGANVTYINGWSFTTPLPTLNGPLQINPITGIIPLVPGAPTGTGIYVIGIEAKEWRYDTLSSGGTYTRIAKQIGYIRRDMTIWIDDTTNCRRDSVHPKSVNITDGGGKTTLDVFFSNGVSTDPNSRVRCATLSPDGSEFRVIDSSNYVAPFDTTVRSIGVHSATWNCYAGLTNKVTLHLAEPLRCQEYWIMLRIGTDLDVLESECGFLEPDSTYGKITVTKDVQVKIDTTWNNVGGPIGKPKSVLSYCLPTEEPFPKLKAFSNDTASFPLDYYWAFRCDTCLPVNNYDTIDGQDVPYMWAKEAGWYELRVRDPLNCTGNDRVRVVYDTNPEFFITVPPYCDKYGESASLPDTVWAPQDPSIKSWLWTTSLGPMSLDNYVAVPNLIEDMKYTLLGTKSPKIAGVEPCKYEYEFIWSRDSFPPQDPLYVKFMEEGMQLCITDGDTGDIQVWQDGVRKKFSPMYIQWYKDTSTIAGQGYSLVVTDTGRYMVHIEDSLGCWNRDTTWVTHDERVPGPEIPCTVAGAAGFFTFVWPEGSQVVENWVSLDGGNTWIPSSNGNLHISYNIENQKFIQGRGRVETACEWTEASVSLECPDQVFPPNVMTPNGDGLNDLFRIEGLELYDNSKVEVFDRWGNSVFSSENYKNDWKGGDLPEGTYYYILEVDDPQGTVHKGILTILR
jgi:gliding motility-associated-like protein